MKEWPCVDHVGPYLQCDRHVSGPSDLGETNGVVEECLRRAHLNQERRQALEICVYWRGQRRAGISPVEIGCGQLFQIGFLDQRVNLGFAVHAFAKTFQIYPRRDTPAASWLRQASISGGDHQCHGQSPSGTVTRHRDVAWLDAAREKEAIAG